MVGSQPQESAEKQITKEQMGFVGKFSLNTWIHIVCNNCRKEINYGLQGFYSHSGQRPVPLFGVKLVN